jgi:site-specific recombinase XerD
VPSHAGLLKRVQRMIRVRRYSQRTEKAYLGWIRRFMGFRRFHDPLDMGSAEVRTYLSHLATRGKMSASTQNQAFSALLSTGKCSSGSLKI